MPKHFANLTASYGIAKRVYAKIYKSKNFIFRKEGFSPVGRGVVR